MFLVLQVATVLLVAIAMSLALAHALELPGKLRLDKESYRSVQRIYYPGFTIGGFSEWLGILSIILLLWLTPASTSSFRWTLVGLFAMVAMHATYWIVTHPVNKFWLKDQDLGAFGAGFFGFDPLKRNANGNDRELWRRLRNRWEYSHVTRAVLSAAALIALVVAVAIRCSA
jgi:hypothetical protein